MLQGYNLLDLKVLAGVSIKTPMSALLDGLKAGVALPRQRLLDDFRLGEGESVIFRPHTHRAIEYALLCRPAPVVPLAATRAP